MNINSYKSRPFILILSIVALILTSCQRDLDELEPATYPVNPDVFLDGFSSGLNYAAFGGSVPSAFDVDNTITYNNTEASMRFEVPDVNDPKGAYAGGVYYTTTPRDLSDFDVLTFYIKASKTATIDIIGFGNDFGVSIYETSIEDVQVNTNWKKVIIPIPDPEKLTAERGMFFYSEGPEDDKGYTFWIDEVQFEKLGTIAYPRFAILNGKSDSITSFAGVSQQISGLSSIYNMPDGTDQSVNISAAFFDFNTTDKTIATVTETGLMKVVGGPGIAKITASIDGEQALGELIVDSKGIFQSAPTPTEDPANVISIFSDFYNNIVVDYYNGYWQPWQTTQSADFEVNGDHVLQYTDFNFVGIEFSSPTIDASQMTHLHIDLFLPSILSSSAQMEFEIVDFGSGGSGIYTETINPSQSQQWISLDIPISSFNGLTNASNLAQIIFNNPTNNISTFYADNIYLYK